MTCEEIYKKIQEIQGEIEKRNAQALSFGYELPPTKAEDLLNILSVRYGLDEAAVKAAIENVEATQKGAEAAAQASEKVANEAINQMKQAQEGPDAPVSKDYISRGLAYLRDKTREVFDATFNRIPKGANEHLVSLFKKMANDKTAMVLGKLKDGSKVTVGSADRNALSRQLENIWREDSKLKSSLSRSDFEEGMTGILAPRDHQQDLKSYISETLKFAEDNVDKNPKLKHLQRMMMKAQTILESGSKETLAWADRQYQELDVIGDWTYEKGILKEKHSDYFPNIVVMQDKNFMDPTDKLLYEKTGSASSFKEQKKHPNMIEAMKAGVMPASLNVVDILSYYRKMVVNAARKYEFGDSIKENASLQNSHANKMMIETSSDSADPAFIRQNHSDPNWEYPKGYRDLSHLGGSFKGILAHPEVNNWIEAVNKTPSKKGLAATYMKFNGMAKSVALFGSIGFHAGSLARKALYMGATNGIEGYWKFPSILAEGLSAVAKGRDYDLLLELMQNDFGIHSHDMLRNSALNRVYNESTGELTAMSKLSDSINKFTNFGHHLLFDKFQLGLKTGMALRYIKSEQFKAMENSIGRQAALRNTAEIFNNTFGAQNLEAIGRSRLVQSFMQAALLAPDWQESKTKRFFGAALAKDPTVRKSFQYALAAEAATVIFTKILAQQVYSQVTGEKRSFEEMAQDALAGKIGSIYVGKTREQNPKDMFMTLFGTENQDWKLFMAPFKGIYDTAANADAAALPKAGLRELKNKLAPIPSAAYEMMDARLEKKQQKKPQPSMYDYGMLPMEAQGPINVLRGAAGGKDVSDRTGLAATDLASQITGTPLQFGKSEKAKKQEAKQKKLQFSYLKK